MVKRDIDIVLGLFGMIVFLPLMVIIAILIKITSKGPVLFSQNRVGLKEKLFLIYKFRTMTWQPGKKGTSITTSKDSRITSVGRFLRKMKLDELPQFINVIKGDMSFVGPRPEVPEIVENYTPEMKRIFEIRPGITSASTLYLKDEESILAQVADPDNYYEKTLVPLKIKIAMVHIDKKSLLFDLKVLLQTVWVLSPFGKLISIKPNPMIEDIIK